MKNLSLFIVYFIVLFSTSVLASELLVLSGNKSQNSKRWQEEVLPGYSSSEIGKTLPVKIIPIFGNSFPDWFRKAMEEGQAGEILGTPTFIIWDIEKNKELGRIEGYTNKIRFYSKLEETISMVAKGLTPGLREGSGGQIRQDEGSAAGSNHRREGSATNQDIMEHIYKTPEEAKRASEMLGLGGKIHSHESPEGTIYMPGSTM